MVKKNKKEETFANSTQVSDEFLFKSGNSSISIKAIDHEERDLEQELFGKKGIKEKIDDIEQELGYGKKSKTNENLKYHNRVFSPTDEEDRKLLNELLNDKVKYSIVMWKDTWTVHGDFRVFVIYSEDITAKSKDNTNEAALKKEINEESNINE